MKIKSSKNYNKNYLNIFYYRLLSMSNNIEYEDIFDTNDIEKRLIYHDDEVICDDICISYYKCYCKILLVSLVVCGSTFLIFHYGM